MPLSKLWAIPSDAASFKWELKFFKPGKQGSFSNKNSILEQANTHRNLLATLTFPFRTVTPQATNIAHLWKVGHADLPRWWAPAGLEKLRGRWGLCRLLATSSPEQCHWRGLELGPCGGHFQGVPKTRSGYCNVFKHLRSYFKRLVMHHCQVISLKAFFESIFPVAPLRKLSHAHAVAEETNWEGLGNQQAETMRTYIIGAFLDQDWISWRENKTGKEHGDSTTSEILGWWFSHP